MNWSPPWFPGVVFILRSAGAIQGIHLGLAVHSLTSRKMNILALFSEKDKNCRKLSLAMLHSNQSVIVTRFLTTFRKNKTLPGPKTVWTSKNGVANCFVFVFKFEYAILTKISNNESIVISQNYKWQNRNVRCLYRLHLKVALPSWRIS